LSQTPHLRLKPYFYKDFPLDIQHHTCYALIATQTAVFMFFKEAGTMNIRAILTLLLLICIGSGSSVIADCPSADLTGDCFVDFADFAVMGAQFLNGYDWNDVNTLANQWLTTDPCVPDDMAYIPDGNFVMGDHSSPQKAIRMNCPSTMYCLMRSL
jgi:hypothetical protein